MQFLEFYQIEPEIFCRNTRSEGAAEGGFKGGIPPRPSVRRASASRWVLEKGSRQGYNFTAD